jgi:predicted NBD/HSP70 family sugar kinase
MIYKSQSKGGNVPELAKIVSSPRRIRQRNELAVLRALHENARLSRADLARELGLNRSSSGNIIGELLAEGLVREVEEDATRTSGRAGRPGILLELVADAVCFLGVEIGVEHISVVELDLSARVTHSLQQPFDGKAAGVEPSLARALHLALTAMTPESLTRCEGLGIAVPAQMDRAGVILVAPLLGWRNVDLVALARKSLPVPLAVMAENDANAFAIGATYGHRIARNGVTLLVNMESGVGGGILINGQLFRGGTGLAGEIGHLRLGPDASTTLEQKIGLTRLLWEYRALTRRADVGLPDLLRDVRDREPGAVVIAEDWARALAFALSQTCRIIDADKIVLGGSVAALYPLVAARVIVHLRSFQEDDFALPEISVAEGVESGAAYGAACMLHQRFLSLESTRFTEAEASADGDTSTDMLRT